MSVEPSEGRRVSPAVRRARLAARHHLAPAASASAAVAAAADVVGFHATDPVSVYLEGWARVRDFQAGDLDTALYEDRSLLKILGMRRTMFVVPVELAGVIQSACTDSIAKGQRSRLVRMIHEAGIARNAGRWLDRVENQTLEALDRLGEATAADLTREVEGLRAQIHFGTGTKWQGQVGVSTRMLFLLAAEGRIIRGRPKGSRLSSLYRWVPMDRWVPGGLATVPKAEAQAELVRRYLRAYGPATLVDIRWWTGWTVGDTRDALESIGAVGVDLDDGASGWILPDDSGPEAAGTSPKAAEPWVALLPSLDATVMGWQQRDWFLGPHAKRLFDRNGNAGPTIWLDGRIVGGWVQRSDGEIAWALLEDVGKDAEQLVEARAARLREWLAELRFVPRFRTPLERELSA
jgi:hypothetical protein